MSAPEERVLAGHGEVGVASNQMTGPEGRNEEIKDAKTSERRMEVKVPILDENKLSEREVFGRRSSLTRSPPTRMVMSQSKLKLGEGNSHRRCGSTGDIYDTIEIDDDIEEAAGGKKIRRERRTQARRNLKRA